MLKQPRAVSLGVSRTKESLKLEKVYGGHLIQPPAQRTTNLDKVPQGFIQLISEWLQGCLQALG